MTVGPRTRSLGRVFDAVAVEYDRNRPTYPEELVADAIGLAQVQPGDRVIELGCGTGQLTGSLARHRLRVTAVEPGEQLIALAARNLTGAGEVEFVNACLEDAVLEPGGFRGAFAAASFHWIDPDVSWRRVAAALVPDGTLTLIQYFGLGEEWSAADQAEIVTALRRVAPELATEWRIYPELETMLEGIEQRCANISEAWAWLTGHELARDHVAALFEPAHAKTRTVRLEHTASQLNAVMGTMSFWARLSAGQRVELQHETNSLQQRLGRPVRSSAVAVALGARRIGTGRRSRSLKDPGDAADHPGDEPFRRDRSDRPDRAMGTAAG